MKHLDSIKEEYEFEKDVLYIEDHLWGDGLNKISMNNEKLTGHIVFRCDSLMSITQILMEYYW